MKEDEKTREQLVGKLSYLQLQNATLEELIAGYVSAQLVAEEARRHAESIMDTVREPLLVLDADLKIISANRSFHRTFKVTPDETIGSFIYELGNKQWNLPKLRKLLEEVLPEKEVFDDFEVEHSFQNIGHKIMLLNARQIYREDIGTKMILLAIEDITERRLIEEKVLLAAIVDSSRDAIIGKSLDGIIACWNKGAEEIYGYTKSEIIGKSISVLVPPEMPDESTNILRKIKLGETIETYETVRQRKDGQYIYVSLKISAIHDTEGTIIGASTVARDITERKKMEKLLSDSEEQYRLLFETANDGILLIEKNEGKIVHINPSVERILGYSARESIGNKLQDVGLIIDNGDFQITMKNLNDRGILYYSDIAVKTKSGQDIYTDTYLVDKAKFAQCNIRDVTERKKAEEELRESEERFRTMFRGHDAIMLLIDQKTGAIRDANLTATRFYGYSTERLCQMTIQEINTLSAEEVAHQRTLAIEQKRNYFIFPHRLASGELKTVEVHSSPIITRDETILFSIIHDITDRMQAEEKILEVTERLQLATVSAKAGVWDWNLQTNEMKWDDRMFELYGLTRENFHGGVESWEQGLHPDDYSRAVEECQAALRGEQDFDTDFRVRHPNGTVIHIKANGLVLRDEKGKPIRMIGLNTDITDRERSAEALRESERRFMDVLYSSPDAILLIDGEQFIDCNEATARMLGYSNRNEFLKTHPSELSPPTQPDGRNSFEKANEMMRIAFEEGFHQFEWEHRRANGEDFLVEVSLTSIVFHGKNVIHCMWRDLTERKLAEEELQQTLESLRKAVGTTIHALVSAVEVRDPYTAGHQIRSADLARAIAAEMGLSQERIKGIRMAGSIHDIGKLSVPADILSKPTKLPELEFRLIKEHAQKGFEMLKDVESPWPLAETVYQHHERMDGSGYPRHLKGEEIIMEARILAIADVVEAMASHRPYRPALGLNAALTEIENNKGTLYDADAVDACLKLFREKGYQLYLG